MALLETTSSPDILTISFVPNEILDALLIGQIQDELLAILKQTEKPNVLLDFRAVRFLSSAALGMLIRAYKRCDEARVRLKLCNLAPSIREVFKITRLDKTFEIHATPKTRSMPSRTTGGTPAGRPASIPDDAWGLSRTRPDYSQSCRSGILPCFGNPASQRKRQGAASTWQAHDCRRR